VEQGSEFGRVKVVRERRFVVFGSEETEAAG